MCLFVTISLARYMVIRGIRINHGLWTYVSLSMIYMHRSVKMSFQSDRLFRVHDVDSEKSSDPLWLVHVDICMLRVHIHKLVHAIWTPTRPLQMCFTTGKMRSKYLIRNVYMYIHILILWLAWSIYYWQLVFKKQKQTLLCYP